MYLHVVLIKVAWRYLESFKLTSEFDNEKSILENQYAPIYNVYFPAQVMMVVACLPYLKMLLQKWQVEYLVWYGVAWYNAIVTISIDTYDSDFAQNVSKNIKQYNNYIKYLGCIVDTSRCITQLPGHAAAEAVTWPRRSWGIHCGQSDEALESPHQGPGVVENEGTLIQKKCHFFSFPLLDLVVLSSDDQKKTSSTTVSSVINQSTNDLVYPASLIYIYIYIIYDRYILYIDL